MNVGCKHSLFLTVWTEASASKRPWKCVCGELQSSSCHCFHSGVERSSCCWLLVFPLLLHSRTGMGKLRPTGHMLPQNPILKMIHDLFSMRFSHFPFRCTSSYVDLYEVGRMTARLRFTLSPLGPPVKKSGAKKRNVDRECQKEWITKYFFTEQRSTAECLIAASE